MNIKILNYFIFLDISLIVFIKLTIIYVLVNIEPDIITKI
jgi:hypothetical protein